MYRNVYGQNGNQIIVIIILDEKDLDYLLDENNDIPITIIEIFLDLLNHSFHNDNWIFIHSNSQGKVYLKQVSSIELDVEIKPNFFSLIQEYYPDKNEHYLYAMKINFYSKESKK